jgi:UDP-N-acetylmuramoyl-L-alanyl-D-glutamate--2,6-diaminopimelate ligase
VPGSTDPIDEAPRPSRLRGRSLRQLAAVVRADGDVGAGIGAELAGDLTLTGIAVQSGLVRPGDLYAALPGERTHGARFAAEAAARGAVAVLTDEAGRLLAAETGLPIVVASDPRAVLGPASDWLYDHPSAAMSVTGVTGTNGKTTTTYLIEAGLRAAGHITGLIGTVRTQVADQILPSAHTTPEAPQLQALFAVMRERGVTAATMEVSSHALALRRVDGTRFAAAAFTNLSHDHLDFHHDLESYFLAKARLFEPGLAQLGVLNVDDPYGRRLANTAAIPLIAVSARGATGADWQARDVELSVGGSNFVAAGPAGAFRAHVSLPGEFNVANALLAIATLAATGVDAEAAIEGIAVLTGVPGRMEAIDAGQPFSAIVDFAHTPDAVATALSTLRAATRGRLIVVVGCGGDRDRSKRPLMAAASARLADLAVLTSDNPRSEDPHAILDEMQVGVAGVPAADRAEVVIEADRAAAIELAVGRARDGDVVVIVGKGHEQGQEVAGVVHPFDDRSVLRAALQARRGSGRSQ